MNLGHICKESELVSHIEKNLFECSLECGKDYFTKSLTTRFTSNQSRLEERAKAILTLRKNLPTRPSFADYKDCKQDETTLRSYKPSQESKTGEQSLFFTGEHTKCLNQAPMFLTIALFMKLYIAPLMGLLTPLILFCMPYVIMRYTMNVEIPWKVYLPMMKSMLFGIQENEPWTLKHYGQLLWTSVSLGQSMIQPCITAYQTSQVDALVQSRGNALVRMVTRGNQILTWLTSIGVLSTRSKFPDIPSDSRQAAAWIDEEPLAYKQIWDLWGEIDWYFTCAKDERWQPVNWADTDIQTGTTLSLLNIHDLAIPESQAVKSIATLRGHSLMTGPNRGGKSSILRAILQQILLGQVTGCTFGSTTRGSWKPFHSLFTRLKSKDNSGKESLFEMEVRMASHMLKTLRVSQRHTLILIDELFHSTNPPDAETSARIFLKQLWAFPQAKSIISTHIFSLCEKCPASVETLCCPAKESQDGSITYSYKLAKGVCRVSSVREVLVEHEILRLNKTQKSM